MRSLEFASLHLERGEPTPRPARRGEERPPRWGERPKSTSHPPRVQIEAARDAVAHVRRLLLLDRDACRARSAFTLVWSAARVPLWG